MGFYFLSTYAYAAPVQIVGVENGALTDFVSTGGTISAQTGTVISGDYTIRNNPVGAAVGWVQVGCPGANGIQASCGLATSYIGFKFRVATLPASGDEEILYIAEPGTGVKSTVRITSGGNLRSYNLTGTLVQTGSTALSLNTTYWITVKSTNSGSASSFELNINGVPELTTALTQGATNVGFYYVGKEANIGGNSVDFFYDDIVIDNSAHPPTGNVVRLVPSAQGSTVDFSAGTAPSDYTQISETVSDGITTYVKKSAAASQANLSAMENSSVKSIGGTIYGVKAWNAIRELNAATSAIGVRIRSSATNADSSTFDASNATFGYQSLVRSTDPATSLAFTTAGIDGLEVGAFDTAAQAESLVSTTHLYVYYNPSISSSNPSNFLLLGVSR